MVETGIQIFQWFYKLKDLGLLILLYLMFRILILKITNASVNML